MRYLSIFSLLLFAAVADAQSTRALQSFENGLTFSRSGDHARAWTEFESTLSTIEREGASDRFFAKTHYNLGVSLYQLRRLDASIVHFDKALQYEQNQYAKAHYALGLARFDRGDFAAARRSLRDAVSLSNRNGEAWFDLAFAHLAANDRGEARRAFEKALKYGAVERATILNNLGVLLAIDGKYAEAIVRFEAAAKSEGRSSIARDNLDLCRKLVGYGSGELLAANFTYAKRVRVERF